MPIFFPILIIEVQVELEILHIPILYPTDISRSSQTMFGILRRFTLDPGISDQITEISEIGIWNHLHKKTNSTSKHHLHRMTKTIKEFKVFIIYIARVCVHGRKLDWYPNLKIWIQYSKHMQSIFYHLKKDT